MNGVVSLNWKSLHHPKFLSEMGRTATQPHLTEMVNPRGGKNSSILLSKK